MGYDTIPWAMIPYHGVSWRTVDKIIHFAGDKNCHYMSCIPESKEPSGDFTGSSVSVEWVWLMKGVEDGEDEGEMGVSSNFLIGVVSVVVLVMG